jgi:arylsulfatase A-like enzyme
MSKGLSRREFLKLSALLPGSLYLSRFPAKAIRSLQDPNARNVLIVIFDALTAKNISLYGYQRETMPNLARMAERATVYHNHYAAGNFTTPGTSSLLTSSYPWTHRAVGLGDTVIQDRAHKTLFSAFSKYYRVAYSHNNFVNILLKEFSQDINYLKPQSDLFVKNDLALDRLFPSDFDIASVSWQRAADKSGTGYSYSLFFSDLYQAYSQKRAKELALLFPRGIPRLGQEGTEYFILETGIDWLKSEIAKFPQPFLGYFHFLPPHHPYSPRRDYINAFSNDNVGYLINKPKSIFAQGKEISLTFQANERRRYDEYVLYADGQLGRLYDYLLESGMLENTWVVFTSDHGEMFERGIFGHRTPVLYESVIRIPLLIIEPGQQRRRDILTTTNAVDVLPTLLKVTGQEIPDWVEGKVVPPFSEADISSDRSIFAVEAKLASDPKHNPLYPVTTTMVKNNYKIMYFLGYEELGKDGSLYELYDLQNDPEELENLYSSRADIASELRNELLTRLTEANQPYKKG